MAGLKLVSVNIERSNHLDRVEHFLSEQKPDVVCFQEIGEHDIPRIEAIMGAPCTFAPVSCCPADAPEEGLLIIGVGICSKLPVLGSRTEYYAGNEIMARLPEDDPHVRNRPLLMCEIECEGAMYRIATTHFTWTPDGRASEEQRQDMKAFLNILAPIREVVLTGDFNAPREIDGTRGEIFTMLSDKYRDNIPSHYITSIDLDLHRMGKTRAFELGFRMVDGLFTTPGYTASDVVLHKGVSDHCAIVADIVKRG